MNGRKDSGGCVVLLSGGLDSAVLLGLLASRGERLVALFADYGQAALPRELEAARALAEHYSAPLEVVKLPFLASWSRSALHAGEPPRPGSLEGEAARRSARSVWVPARNAVLLSVAAALAESGGMKTVAFGANAEEGAAFPDNSAAFAAAAAEFLRLGTMAGVTVEAPLAALDKRGVAELGLRLGVPLRLVWSCYRAGRSMCGACESCLRFERALRAAGAPPQLLARFER